MTNPPARKRSPAQKKSTSQTVPCSDPLAPITVNGVTKTTRPSLKDIRHVLRGLTPLYNADPDTKRRVHEVEILQKKSSELADELEKDVKEVIWTRIYLEKFFVKPLKEDKSLWDGSRRTLAELDFDRFVFFF